MSRAPFLYWSMTVDVYQLYGAFLVFYLPYAVGICVLLLRRRNSPSVRSRGLEFTLVSMISGTVCVVGIAIRETDVMHFPCWLYGLLSGILAGCFFMPYTMRVGKLYLVRVVEMTRTRAPGHVLTWKHEGMLLTGPMGVRFIYAVLLFFVILFSLFMTWSIDKSQVFAEGGCVFAGEFVGLAVLGCSVVGFLILAVIMARALPEDRFQHVAELRVLLMGWVPLGVAFFLFNLLPSLMPFGEWLRTSWFVILAVIWGQHVSGLQAVMRTLTSYATYERVTQKANNMHLQSASTLLSEPDWSDLFLCWMGEAHKEDQVVFLAARDFYTYSCLSDEDRLHKLPLLVETYFDQRSAKSLRRVYETDDDFLELRGLLMDQVRENRAHPDDFTDELALCYRFLDEVYTQEFFASRAGDEVIQRRSLVTTYRKGLLRHGMETVL